MAAEVSGHYGAVRTYPATPVVGATLGPMKGIGPYGSGVCVSRNPGGEGGLGTGFLNQPPVNANIGEPETLTGKRNILK